MNTLIRRPSRGRLAPVWICLLLGVAFLFSAHADDVDTALANFQEALRNTPAPSADNPRAVEIQRQLPLLFDQISSNLKSDNDQQVEMIVQQLGSLASTDDLRKAAAGLAKAIREWREAREKERAAHLEKEWTEIGKLVAAATEPEDMDPVLQRLADLRARVNSMNNSSDQRAAQVWREKVESALEFAKQWQDYLLARSDNAIGPASGALGRILEQNRYPMEWIPRSKILRLQHEIHQSQRAAHDIHTQPTQEAEDQIVEIVAGIHTLDDLQPAVAKLRELMGNKHSVSSGGYYSVVRTLWSLDQAWRDFLSGQQTRIELFSSEGEPPAFYPNPVPAIRAQVLVRVLPRYLGLPEGTVAKDTDTPGSFLDRVEAEAGASGDYLLAAKAAETRNLLRFGRRDSQRISQAEQFVTAENLEKAGQPMLAVVGYLKALEIPSQVVPPMVIGERLAAIREKNPEVFDQGLSLFLSPPKLDPSIQTLLMRTSMGGMPGPQGGPPQPQPSLSVPAAPAKNSNP